ncbi:FMN-binding protein [Miniphocaeibacter massiliensis]|uniref:FMN-binding protein n=1 Tax=Miniphocaeibacter massiliensis TaxID=2041841 RepID=UPI000C1BDFCF|nr:FMN-binding protein [Miniphocaeibacter massiliensis]
MKNAIVLAVKLFVITAIAAVLLALVNGVTSPVIEERAKKEYADSLKVVFEGADSFKSIGDMDVDTKEELEKIKEANTNIDDIVFAYSGEDIIGYVFKTIGKGGYGGDITFVIGVNKEDHNITGYKVLSHSETKGFGSQVTEEPFIGSVVGKNMDKEMVSATNPSSENEIQAISGTTISVTAILNGLNGAVDALASIAE